MLTAREILEGKAKDKNNQEGAETAHLRFNEWLDKRRENHPFPNKVNPTLRNARRYIKGAV